ncbi:MAG: hypothetical protein NC489_23645 [Ruminococcus flavefaciens]|nr:hypothetical protein [Ruminococcus flavefaciens]
MKLGQLVNRLDTCQACISITGLCDEYRGGVWELKQEDWYLEARSRKVKRFGIIGSHEDNVELYITLEDQTAGT